MSEEKQQTPQSSLAGAVITEEEKLRQAKKAEMKKKYRLMSIALIAIIIVAGVFFAKSIWTGWISSSGNRYYYIKGEKVIGLATIENKQYFFDDSGAMQTGWQNADGNTYYFSSDGVMQTGWVELSEKKYYLATSGVLQTGWKKIDGNNYLFDGNGVMQTDWQTVDGSTYYFNNDGIMQTGFQTINGNKYYLGNSGVLHTGWLSHKNQTYYCSSSNGGKLATGKWTIDGENYYFNNDGIMATGSVEITPNNYYFFNEGGCFQYCDITKTNINTTSSDSYVTFTNRGGGYTRSHSRYFDDAIENVLSLQIELKITGMDYGNANGRWQVHVRTLDGKWKRIGYFDVSNDVGIFEITFDEPISFDAFICTCYESTSWSGHFQQNLEELTYRSYDFGSNVKHE